MIFLKFLFVLLGILAEREQFKADSDAFLFALVGPVENGPQKISLNPGVINGGIHCGRNLGPSFGLGYGMEACGDYDLRFVGRGTDFLGSFNFGHAFECPSNMGRWSPFFRRDCDLSFSELEVFQVKF